MTDGEEGRGFLEWTLEFRELEEADHRLLLEWLLRPHVRLWWDEGEHTIEKVREAYGPEPGVGRFIAVLRSKELGTDRPFGYFQHYRADENTVGIDQFIGEPDLIGKGLGTRAVAAFTDMVFSMLAPERIILDPHPDNGRAIRCYEKAGFRHCGITAGDGRQPAYLLELLINDVRNR
ncbi:MAG TPA: GNAT family N-acetyltransferase [Aridibacter sp.]|nr:GNAT family N-acetyltransferase [Aridibacter sp.]